MIKRQISLNRCQLSKIYAFKYVVFIAYNFMTAYPASSAEYQQSSFSPFLNET